MTWPCIWTLAETSLSTAELEGIGHRVWTAKNGARYIELIPGSPVHKGNQAEGLSSALHQQTWKLEYEI